MFKSTLLNDLWVFWFSILHTLRTWWHRKELEALECYANCYAARWFEIEKFQQGPVQQRITATVWGLGWDFCQYKTGEEIAGLAIALQITSSNIEHQTKKYAPVIRILKERECVSDCATYLERVLGSCLTNHNGRCAVESKIARASKTLWSRLALRDLEQNALTSLQKYVDNRCEVMGGVETDRRFYIERSHWTNLRGIIVSLGYHALTIDPELLARYAASINYTLYIDGENHSNPIERNSFPINQITGYAIYAALESRTVCGDLRTAEDGSLY
ncbi:MAG: hypothetical protein HY225_01185 [Candidatus Vogelbacteria bacterium]|nr:hypothetical protein [Candidatus Vogelbacteria bacterium]